MAGSLLRHRNLLVVDARGTGRSTPLNCAPLQQLSSPSDQFPEAAKRCGEQLNHTFRRTNGAFVHASDLFGTANAASGIADVIGRLGLGRGEFYGDSYGSYVAQSFLARYPESLRSVVMDSAYEARGLNPSYTTSVTTARSAINTVCRRTAGCPATVRSGCAGWRPSRCWRARMPLFVGTTSTGTVISVCVAARFATPTPGQPRSTRCASPATRRCPARCGGSARQVGSAP